MSRRLPWKEALFSLAFCAAGAAAHAASIPAPHLQSVAALVMDEETGEVLYGKNTAAILPIASITKLMTAMVTLDAELDLAETVVVSEDEVEATHGQRSRLRPGTALTRDDLLRLALMASENRAAAALARSHPGGTAAFVRAMNAKAAMLGMRDTHYVEATGLSSQNVASARDLALLVRAANGYPLIREYSTSAAHEFELGGRKVAFVNTNGLVRSSDWDIGVSKTGFIREAGRCLVMQARLATRPVIIVLLDSFGRFTRIADASRIRAWLEPGYSAPALNAPAVTARRKPAAGPSRVRVQIKPPAPR